MSAAEEKPKLILDAAVRVFARQGFAATRVGDIAKEAGVAYGLVYHYYGSKDAVLEAVFREAWGRLIEASWSADQGAASAPERLERAIKVALRSWRDEPDLVRLVTREVTRSPHFQDEIDEIGRGFAGIQSAIEQGQTEGTLRRDVDARLTAWMLYGALEEILTGWVLGQLPDDAEAVARAEREVIATFVGGLRVRP